MILGPVFNAELVATSRRRRYYLTRLVYGLCLLLLVAWTYEGLRRDREAAGVAGGGFRVLAMTAEAIFSTFITAQVAAVLALTPALVAGTIADEKQRKTLHYLLASQLSSLEIVGGKLAARMLLLIVLVMVGLPIMSILSLFGGLDPPLILAAFLGSVTTSYALAGLSIFVSTVSKRARDAIVTVYVIEAIWLIGPTVVAAVLGPSSPETLSLLASLADPILRLDPFQLARLSNPSPELTARLAWMAGLQAGLGTAFVLLALWRLRPSFASGDRARSASGESSGGGVWRLFRRPAVGDDPMLWKERHVSRLGLVVRVFGMMIGVFAVVFLGDALIDLGRPALAELGKYGYGDGTGVEHKARDGLQSFLATAAAVAYVVWIGGVACSAAAGISSEREDDTWISLLGTTLTGWEILRGKALGALWRWRTAGLMVLVLWTFGLVAGAVHPLAYLLAVALFAAFTAFALALGTYFSLRARSTTRAMVATTSVLLVLNGGYLMCLSPLGHRIDPMWMAPCTPYVIGVAPETHATIQTLFGTYPSDSRRRLDVIASQVLTCVVSLVAYGVAAAALGAGVVGSFDGVAGRPRRPPGYSRALAASLEPEAIPDPIPADRDA